MRKTTIRSFEQAKRSCSRLHSRCVNVHTANGERVSAKTLVSNKQRQETSTPANSCLLAKKTVPRPCSEFNFAWIVSRFTPSRCAKVYHGTGRMENRSKGPDYNQEKALHRDSKTRHILWESEHTTKLDRVRCSMSHRMQCTDVRDDGWFDERMLRMKCDAEGDQ